VLEIVARDVEGFPLDLAAFTSVRFFMRKRGADTLKVDKDGAFGVKSAGEIQYAWEAEDTDTAGVFFAEFELRGASGMKATMPQSGQIRVEIAGDLDDA